MTINRFEQEKIHNTIETMIAPFKRGLTGETRNILERDCYVAGGAIVSILQGETPKDIDIFCEDQKKANKLSKHLVEKAISRLNFIAEGHLTFRCSINNSRSRNDEYRMICGAGATIHISVDINSDYALTNNLYNTMKKRFRGLGNKTFHRMETNIQFDIKEDYGLDLLPASKVPYDDMFNGYDAILPFLNGDEYNRGLEILNIYKAIVKLSRLVDVKNLNLPKGNGAYILNDIEKVIEEYVLAITHDNDDVCCTCTMIPTSIDVTRVSNFAITCGDIQLITGSAGLPTERINEFDFKHCMAYKHIGYPSVFCSSTTEKCIRDKVLLLNLGGRVDRIKLGEFTYKERIDRFIRRGYYLSKDELSKADAFVQKICGKNFDDVLFKDGDNTIKPKKKKIIPKRKKGCA